MVKKFKDRVTGRWLGFALGLFVITVSTTRAAQGNPSPDAAVTQLADAFVDEYERRFPFAVMEAGLELKSQSGININAPVELARWRQFVGRIESQLARIPESAVAGTPAWVTHAFLRQAIAQQRSAEVCRSELWTISPYEWAFRLLTQKAGPHSSICTAASSTKWADS